MAQVHSCRSLAEEARVRYRPSLCETCGGRSDSASQICLRGMDKDNLTFTFTCVGIPKLTFSLEFVKVSFGCGHELYRYGICGSWHVSQAGYV